MPASEASSPRRRGRSSIPSSEWFGWPSQYVIATTGPRVRRAGDRHGTLMNADNGYEQVGDRMDRPAEFDRLSRLGAVAAWYLCREEQPNAVRTTHKPDRII